MLQIAACVVVTVRGHSSRRLIDKQRTEGSCRDAQRRCSEHREEAPGNAKRQRGGTGRRPQTIALFAELTDMGIRVDCPNGHHFKVKAKYAGKKGLCPYCESVVRVPALDPELTEKRHREVVAQEVRAQHAATAVDPDSSSVLDDDLPSNSSTSGSLLGSSVIRHTVKCSCGQAVPMWFARCPGCGKYLEQR